MKRFKSMLTERKIHSLQPVEKKFKTFVDAVHFQIDKYWKTQLQEIIYDKVFKTRYVDWTGDYISIKIPERIRKQFGNILFLLPNWLEKTDNILMVRPYFKFFLVEVPENELDDEIFSAAYHDGPTKESLSVTLQKNYRPPKNDVLLTDPTKIESINISVCVAVYLPNHLINVLPDNEIRKRIKYVISHEYVHFAQDLHGLLRSVLASTHQAMMNRAKKKKEQITHNSHDFYNTYHNDLKFEQDADLGVLLFIIKKDVKKAVQYMLGDERIEFFKDLKKLEFINKALNYHIPRSKIENFLSELRKHFESNSYPKYSIRQKIHYNMFPELYK